MTEQYLVGDWNNDDVDELATLNGDEIYFDIGGGWIHTTNLTNFGNATAEDEYLVGDWDGDGDDELAIRRGNEIYRMSDIWNGNFGILPVVAYGNVNLEDEYLVGDWDGDGDDNIAVRRGFSVYMNYDWDGQHDIIINYGRGNLEDEYLVGDWDADGVDELAVRRGNEMLLDSGDGVSHEWQEFYEYDGMSTEEVNPDQYLVGNWVDEPTRGFNQDDNFGIRLGDHAFLDTNYDPILEEIELFPL